MNFEKPALDPKRTMDSEFVRPVEEKDWPNPQARLEIGVDSGIRDRASSPSFRDAKLEERRIDGRSNSDQL